MAARKPNTELCGQWLKGADGNVYRASMWTTGTEPWGRINGDDAFDPREIPRPLVVLMGRSKEGTI
jgi:hypothetical protein